MDTFSPERRAGPAKTPPIRRLLIDAMFSETPWDKVAKQSRAVEPAEWAIMASLANLYAISGSQLGRNREMAILRQCLNGGHVTDVADVLGYDMAHPGTPMQIARLTGGIVQDLSFTLGELRNRQRGKHTLNSLVVHLGRLTEERLEALEFPNDDYHAGARALAEYTVGKEQATAVQHFVAHTSNDQRGLFTYMPTRPLESVLEQVRLGYAALPEDASAGAWMLSEMVGNPAENRLPKTFYDLADEVDIEREHVIDLEREFGLAPETLESHMRRLRSTIDLGKRAAESAVIKQQKDESGDEPDPETLAALEDEAEELLREPVGEQDRGGTLNTWGLYLNEIGKIPLLSREEQLEMGKRIEAGLYAAHLLEDMQAADEPVDPQYVQELELVKQEGGAAKTTMLNANLRLVVSIAKRYVSRCRHMKLEDLNTEGVFGLMRAIEKYDYTLGHKFSTYGTWWVRQSISRAIADQDRDIRLPVSQVESLNRFLRVRSDLRGELMQEPTIDQLAKALDITAEEITKLSEYARLTVTTPLEMLVGEEKETELGDLLADPDAPDPLSIIIARIEGTELGRLIARIDRTDALAFLKFHGIGTNERTITDIAQSLGEKTTEVRTRIERAREKLERILTNTELTPEEEAALEATRAQDALFADLPEDISDQLRELRAADPERLAVVLGMAFEAIPWNFAVTLWQRYGFAMTSPDAINRHKEAPAHAKEGCKRLAAALPHIMSGDLKSLDMGNGRARVYSPLIMFLDAGVPVPENALPEERRATALKLVRESGAPQRFIDAAIMVYGLDGNAPRSYETVGSQRDMSGSRIKYGIDNKVLAGMRARQA